MQHPVLQWAVLSPETKILFDIFTFIPASHLNNKRRHKDIPQLLANRWPFQFQSVWAPEQKNYFFFQALDSPTPKIQEQEELGWPYFLLLGAGVSHILIEVLLGFSFISRHPDSRSYYLSILKPPIIYRHILGHSAYPLGITCMLQLPSIESQNMGFVPLAKFLMKEFVVLASAIAEFLAVMT